MAQQVETALADQEKDFRVVRNDTTDGNTRHCGQHPARVALLRDRRLNKCPWIMALSNPECDSCVVLVLALQNRVPSFSAMSLTPEPQLSGTCQTRSLRTDFKIMK